MQSWTAEATRLPVISDPPRGIKSTQSNSTFRPKNPGMTNFWAKSVGETFGKNEFDDPNLYKNLTKAERRELKRVMGYGDDDGGMGGYGGGYGASSSSSGGLGGPPMPQIKEISSSHNYDSSWETNNPGYLAGLVEKEQNARTEKSMVGFQVEAGSTDQVTSNQRRKHQITWQAAQAKIKQSELAHNVSSASSIKHESKAKYGW